MIEQTHINITECDSIKDYINGLDYRVKITDHPTHKQLFTISFNCSPYLTDPARFALRLHRDSLKLLAETIQLALAKEEQ